MKNTTRYVTALVAFVSFGLVSVLFGLWFVFASTQYGHRAEVGLNGLLPMWLIAINLLLLPCLAAFTAGSSRIPISLRFSLGVLMFCSIVTWKSLSKGFLWVLVLHLRSF
jgi:hypothetical protein